jgi:hypothetical protein
MSRGNSDPVARGVSRPIMCENRRHTCMLISVRHRDQVPGYQQLASRDRITADATSRQRAGPIRTVTAELPTYLADVMQTKSTTSGDSRCAS